MFVVPAPPDDGPRISGGQDRYKPGDTVNVNCTSGRSKPAVQLAWYINGEQVSAACFDYTNCTYAHHIIMIVPAKRSRLQYIMTPHFLEILFSYLGKKHNNTMIKSYL